MIFNILDNTTELWMKNTYLVKFLALAEQLCIRTPLIKLCLDEGVTTWCCGEGNNWKLEGGEAKGNLNIIQLKSWKNDYLHRPDNADGITSWHTGKGNNWNLEIVSGAAITTTTFIGK